MVTDLDRTLTGPDLRLDAPALERIQLLRRSGIRVVVATGRRFDDGAAMALLPHVDGMVAENGAVVCVPQENTLEVLHSDFSQVAQKALADLSDRFEWGRVVGSGPRELAMDAVKALAAGGVAHHIEFNAEHVMLLPEGVDKATGAKRCVDRLDIHPNDTWAIGDGENDASMLGWAGLGAAPANAAPAATNAADVLLVSSYADAFLELTEPLVRAGGGRPSGVKHAAGPG